VKLFIIDKSKQNPNCNSTMATDYKGSRDVQVTPGHNPNGLDTIHDPTSKNDGAAPRPTMDIQFVSTISIDFR
jgi:hypothetical protein